METIGFNPDQSKEQPQQAGNAEESLRVEMLDLAGRRFEIGRPHAARANLVRQTLLAENLPMNEKVDLAEIFHRSSERVREYLSRVAGFQFVDMDTPSFAIYPDTQVGAWADTDPWTGEIRLSDLLLRLPEDQVGQVATHEILHYYQTRWVNLASFSKDGLPALHAAGLVTVSRVNDEFCLAYGVFNEALVEMVEREIYREDNSQQKEPFLASYIDEQILLQEFFNQSVGLRVKQFNDKGRESLVRISSPEQAKTIFIRAAWAPRLQGDRAYVQELKNNRRNWGALMRAFFGDNLLEAAILSRMRDPDETEEQYVKRLVQLGELIDQQSELKR